jgi:hypothetical protein
MENKKYFLCDLFTRVKDLKSNAYDPETALRIWYDPVAEVYTIEEKLSKRFVIIDYAHSSALAQKFQSLTDRRLEKFEEKKLQEAREKVGLTEEVLEKLWKDEFMIETASIHIDSTE